MRKTFCLTIVLLGASIALLLLAGSALTDRDVKAAPPLSIEHLLDEELPEAPREEEEILADNSACFVCHGNYQEEPMALRHAKEDIGCVDCHGPSHAHRNDEDNVTPPDVMFAMEDIDSSCGKCHRSHDARPADVVARWKERCPAKTDPEKLVCTDCHGRHRLKFRTVWWNKKTGELVVREEGQLTKPAEDLTKTPPQATKEAGATK